MGRLVDCPTCGGLLPVERGCCPHCHCRYSRWRRWALLASAALGLGGAAGCQAVSVPHYGTNMIPDGGSKDRSVASSAAAVNDPRAADATDELTPDEDAADAGR